MKPQKNQDLKKGGDRKSEKFQKQNFGLALEREKAGKKADPRQKFVMDRTDEKIAKRQLMKGI